MLNAFGVLPKNQNVIQLLKSSPRSPDRIPRRAQRVAREFQRMLQVIGKDEDVKIQYDKQGGLKIELPSQILFDVGRADVKPEAYDILTTLGTLLADLPGKFIEVRGHTDNLPMSAGSAFKDNEDLSYYRAKNVMQILNVRGRIPRDEFEVIACGEWQPIATNDTPEGREKNRRVEVQVRGQFEEETAREVREMIRELVTPAERSEEAPLTGAPTR